MSLGHRVPVVFQALKETLGSQGGITLGFQVLLEILVTQGHRAIKARPDLLKTEVCH